MVLKLLPARPGDGPAVVSPMADDAPAMPARAVPANVARHVIAG
jgi:hypothetical protein